MPRRAPASGWRADGRSGCGGVWSHSPVGNKRVRREFFIYQFVKKITFTFPHNIVIRHFVLNRVSDSDLDPALWAPESGFLWPKVEKNLQLKKIKLFWIKTTIYQVTKEAFSSQKRTSSTSKHEISKFFLHLWVIVPSWIRIRIPNTDPDPLTWLNPDPKPWC